MDDLSTVLTVPDIWQQRAVNLLRAGYDVIVDAPTSAGKTRVFELFVEENFSGQAVFTVPTRALANDKLLEWRARGWNVGIQTGDLSYNSSAPIIVATLETQKHALMTGRGPSILVVDEYQMLSDPARGVNYELAIAAAPPSTQLLLLSGSVANPDEVCCWLQRCNRKSIVVQHKERPVPLNEINLEALRDPLPKTIQGRWPRYIARALKAELGPILIFAPRRKAAESMARMLASALPADSPLVLSQEQQAIAGNELTRCLKARIAWHHSGMSYAQRAGLIEPLAKNNQLKVIVATTGLASGINFSLRSVLVLEKEYRTGETHCLIQPDELLQMFGRAGRRGLDDRGSVLYTEGKARLAEARPLKLKRGNTVDWPSLITLIDHARTEDKSPLQATRNITARLFSNKPVRIGLDDFLNQRQSTVEPPQEMTPDQKLEGGVVLEFKNSAGLWERQRAPSRFKLTECLYQQNDEWLPALAFPSLLSDIGIGTLYRQGPTEDRTYGIDAPIAHFPLSEKDDRLQLCRWLRLALREYKRSIDKPVNVPRKWTIEKIEQTILPILPYLTRGGRGIELNENKGVLIARLDYREAEILAYRDPSGKGLINPKQRRRRIGGTNQTVRKKNRSAGTRLHLGPSSIAEYWFSLGLIDARAHPTRRGKLFSFFNQGEGLAIAAALEETTYPVEEILYDLANLRAGHRFNSIALAGRPLTAICQAIYGATNIPGYLRRGLPESYGEGASEVLYNLENKSSRLEHYLDDDLSYGDIERARLEWHSLCSQIAHSPDLEWDRWMNLKEICLKSLNQRIPGFPFETLPPLTREQTATL